MVKLNQIENTGDVLAQFFVDARPNSHGLSYLETGCRRLLKLF